MRDRGQVEVHSRGSLCLVFPLTDAAAEWLESQRIGAVKDPALAGFSPFLNRSCVDRSQDR